MGMTAEQYWDGDCSLVVYYRKAANMERELLNQKLWLQGRYFYDALCAVAPIFNSNSKKGTRAREYPKEPYILSTEEAERQEDRKAKQTYNRAKLHMERFMLGNNKKFEGGESDG